MLGGGGGSGDDGLGSYEQIERRDARSAAQG